MQRSMTFELRLNDVELLVAKPAMTCRPRRSSMAIDREVVEVADVVERAAGRIETIRVRCRRSIPSALVFHAALTG